MKPEDLKSPFSWKDRTVLIQDGILYIPEYFDKYQEFLLPSWAEIFGNSNPVKVEFCSGNGAWIAAKAAAHPNYNWVAVEKKFPRVRKIWSKKKNFQLKNLFIVCGEAMCVTSHYFRPQEFSEVFINFPDPWPKNKHAKHRIIRPDFVQQLSRVMQTRGILSFVTDDPGYSEEAISVLHRHGIFQSLYEKPYFTADFPDYGCSYFEELWRSKGKEIRYHQFECLKQCRQNERVNIYNECER